MIAMAEMLETIQITMGIAKVIPMIKGLISLIMETHHRMMAQVIRMVKVLIKLIFRVD
jgi:hypothetical protein